MKLDKIIYWTTTTIIFLFEGVLVALTSHTEFAMQAIAHLGYPIYFGIMLSVFKILGSLALILPMVPKMIKEWAYAGFGITMIAALVSLWATDGFSGMLAMPVVFFLILAASYVYYHKLYDKR